MPEITVNFNGPRQNKVPQLANEVNKLFSLYRVHIGDKQPMVGGAQGLLMKFDRQRKSNMQHLDANNKYLATRGLHFVPLVVEDVKTCPPALLAKNNASLEDLPVDIALHILELLQVSDLYNTCLVSSYWHSLSNHERLWKNLLHRDSLRWRQIHHDRNPDVYRQVRPSLSSKQIYFKCREKFTANYANVLNGNSREANPLSSLFLMIMPSGRPRILMFGPGLETKTSKIVRSILTDRCMNESARFKVTGLVPGGFSGVGSGISIRFEEREFNLVVLYSNVKAVRQRLSAENRVRENKLFVHHEERVSNNVTTTTNNNNNEPNSSAAAGPSTDATLNNNNGSEASGKRATIVKQYYEVTPAVQELSKSSHAFIFIADATQTAQEVAYAQTELCAMSCELWSPSAAPLLVLSCRRNCAPKEALSSIQVVRALRLGRLNKKWMAQSAEVETLDGVRSGMRWLLSQV